MLDCDNQSKFEFPSIRKQSFELTYNLNSHVTKNTWHFFRQKRNTLELFTRYHKNHLLLFFTSLRKNKLFNLSIFFWPVSKKRLFSIYSWIVDTVESHLVPKWQLTALHIELFCMWGYIKSLILQEKTFCIAIANIIHTVPILKFKKIIYFWNPKIKINLGLIKCPCLSVHSFAIDGICGVYSLIRAKVDGFFTIMALFSF